MSEVIQAINLIGFPAVMCIILLVLQFKILKPMSDKLIELAVLITDLADKLENHIKEDEKNDIK